MMCDCLKNRISNIIGYLNLLFVLALNFSAYHIVSSYEEAGIGMSPWLMGGCLILIVLVDIISILLVFNRAFSRKIIGLYVMELFLLLGLGMIFMMPVIQVIDHMGSINAQNVHSEEAHGCGKGGSHVDSFQECRCSWELVGSQIQSSGFRIIPNMVDGNGIVAGDGTFKSGADDACPVVTEEDVLGERFRYILGIDTKIPFVQEVVH